MYAGKKPKRTARARPTLYAPPLIFSLPQTYDIVERQRSLSRSIASDSGGAASATSGDESEQFSQTDVSDVEGENSDGTPFVKRQQAGFLHAPNYRHAHLLRVHDLLALSIARNDVRRSQRCLNILLKSYEWPPADLWRHALQVRTMTVAARLVPESASEEQLSRNLTQERLQFLRKVLDRRMSKLQVDILIEIVPELLALGEEEQAYEEIEIVLNRHPFRMEPLLHLYGAMLYLDLSTRSLFVDADDERDALRVRLQNVSTSDMSRAHVSPVLLLLADRGNEVARGTVKKATDRFQMAMNVGKMADKRGRRDIQSAAARGRSRSRSKSQSRSRSQSVSSIRRRTLGYSSASGSESEGPARKRSRYEHQLLTATDSVKVEMANDEWARDLARAYVAVLRATVKLTPEKVSDEEGEEEEEEEEEEEGEADVLKSSASSSKESDDDDDDDDPVYNSEDT